MSTPLPLRDMQQSISPDPPDGWPTQHTTTTTPLRIAKRDSPTPARHGGAQLDRRQSSSYRHMKNNSLVSKSPFRSQIPTPSRPSAPPSPRKVSGEKRPRSTSFLSQAENERPQGFKRRQSKAYLGLVQKEPVTKSPFRQTSLQQHNTGDEPVPPLPPKSPKSSPRRPTASPARPSLVTRRLHGPRKTSSSSNSSVRRRRRKTVTFDERCDVLEFDVDDEVLEEFPFASDDDGGEEDEDELLQEVSVDDDPEPGDTIADTVDSVLREAAGSEDAPDPAPRVSSPLDTAYPPLQPDRSPLSRSDISDSADLFATPSHSRMSTPKSTPPTHGRAEHPPPKHSTHSARAVDHGGHNWDQDVQMLPPSPSPAKVRPAPSLGGHEPEGPMPKFNLDTSRVKPHEGSPADPFAVAAREERDAHVRRESAGRRSLTEDERGRGSPVPSAKHVQRASPRGQVHLPHSLLEHLDRSPTATPVNSPDFEEHPPLGVMAFHTPPTSAGERSPEAKKPALRRATPSAERILTGDTSRDGGEVSVRDGNEREDGVEDEEYSTQPNSAENSLLQPARDEEEPKRETQEVPRRSLELPRLTRQNPTFDGVLSIDPEPQPQDPPRPAMLARANTADGIEPTRPLELRASPEKGAQRTSVALGDVSALDRLVESVWNGGSRSGSGDESSFLRDVQAGAVGSARVEPGPARNRVDNRTQSVEPPVAVRVDPPPPPPKDAIRAREELIKQKKREARRREMEDEMEVEEDEEVAVAAVRPRRRRSLSTGDAPAPARAAAMAQAIAARKRATRSVVSSSDGLLDVLSGTDDPLSDSINRELRKLDGSSRGSYHVRERSETIYASSDADRVSHIGDAGDVDGGRAWKAVRRPSDMNEYSKQLRELRAQDKSGKAQGKVFVRVAGLKNINVPLPSQPTIISCTLNNGIHYVSTPPSRLAQSCPIDQEFELIEHSKLEFTLTIKVRRDPHIVAQFDANNPPKPPPPQPAPPPASKGGGMRHFFLGGSPKKATRVAPRPAPPPVLPKQPENLARYLKNDGTLARAFVSFKDIASRCDTKLFETSYPLIGQKSEWGAAAKTMQVGEIVLQIFRLPPLPGVPPDQLPQSLEDCHRGLRHMNWHKVTYFEGTLTQSGGDCMTWRRRHLRVIGANLVAFNDVTKRATATIDLKKAIAVEDDQEARANARTPQLGSTGYADDYDFSYGADRSFRLIFPAKQQILFFADTDEEKARWLEVLRALVGRIPPYPLWAELVWQRQQELAKALPSKPGPSS